MGYSVSQVAQIAGVTVRTLHHYDDIGLLRPSGRTSSGYRRYDEQDLERLRLILVYRELGFTLEEIRSILAAADPSTHLRRQHRLLRQRIERLREMVTAIEYLLEAQTMGISLSPEEKFEVFGDFDPDRTSRRPGSAGVTATPTGSRPGGSPATPRTTGCASSAGGPT